LNSIGYWRCRGDPAGLSSPITACPSRHDGRAAAIPAGPDKKINSKHFAGIVVAGALSQWRRGNRPLQVTANSEAFHRPALAAQRQLDVRRARRHEETMSLMSLNVITVGRRRVSRWSRVIQDLAKWQRRTRSRYELRSLSDRCLEDIDMTRIAETRHCTSDFEACKPFWMA
jgi:uncharacterized protein YjiS (DUF1127 family)